MNDREKVEFLLKQIRDLRALLEVSLSILNSKNTIILKKDDDLVTAVELYKSRLSEYGIE